MTPDTAADRAHLTEYRERFRVAPPQFTDLLRMAEDGIAAREALVESQAEVVALTARVRNLARMRGEKSARSRLATVEPILASEDARLRAVWPEPEPYQEGYLDGFDAARQYTRRAITGEA